MEKPTFETMPSILLDVQTNQQKLADQISEFKKTFEERLKPNQKEILTIEEACELLGVNRSTLYKWEKAKTIPSYGLEKRRYFKYSDILSRILPLNK